MATRRMFSQTIVDTDEFLDMPTSARLLYYDLGMRADDDGFVNPKRIMRMTNANDDDLKVLLAKKYVLGFEDKVLVIRDWKVNNFIRPDRYTPTIYQEYLKRLSVTDTNQYSDKRLSSGIPNDIPTVDPGKVRKGKDRVDKDTNGEEVPSPDESSPFSTMGYLGTLRATNTPRNNLVADYWTVRGFHFPNKKAADLELRRDYGPIKKMELTEYDSGRVLEVMRWLQDNVDFKWTLETIPKYINEDLSKLEGDKPHIFVIK